MPCDKKSKRCTELDICCIENIKNLIKYTSGLLKEFDIKYWIDFNLLNSVFKYEFFAKDNVFSIFSKDEDKILQLSHRIYEDGYFLTKCNENNCNKIKIHYSKNNLINIEILSWEEESGYLFKRCNGIDKKTRFKSSYVYPLENISLNEDISLSCTNNLEEFYNMRKGISVS